MTEQDSAHSSTPDYSHPGAQHSGRAILRRSQIAANYSLVGLFVLLTLVVLYHIGDFMVPVIGALLLNLILSPATNLLHRIYIPYPIGAGFVVAALLGLIVAAGFWLSEPVSRWITDIPEALQRFEEQSGDIRQPIEDVQKATEEVEKITKVDESDDAPQAVVVSEPSLTTRLFGSLTNLVLQLGLMLILLYFLLAVGDLFQTKLIHGLPRLKDKLKAQQFVRQVVHDMSRYLVTVTVINIGMGTLVGLALYLLDMPNPILWGVMAALLNYVPYLGGMVGVSIVAVASFITFDNTAQALLPPLAYAAINFTEGQLVTPGIVSRSLTLNPVVVFLFVSFWAWFWGIPGALMAVPILVVIKILSDHVDGLAPLSAMLSGRRGRTPLPGDPA